LIPRATVEKRDADGGLNLTVAGLMQPELLALQKAHEVAAPTEGEEKKMLRPLAASRPSAPNLSSIAARGVDGKVSRRAIGDKIRRMELVGLIQKRQAARRCWVPHHGSDNMETTFSGVTADYVMSGDSQHGNPGARRWKCSLSARGDEADYQIHLTYPVTTAGAQRDWEKEQAKEKNSEENQTLLVRRLVT
jgi:hypothetical protein